jgi:hypothetical protein
VRDRKIIKKPGTLSLRANSGIFTRIKLEYKNSTFSGFPLAIIIPSNQLECQYKIKKKDVFISNFLPEITLNLEFFKVSGSKKVTVTFFDPLAGRKQKW